jgi:hypothetical protein
MEQQFEGSGTGKNDMYLKFTRERATQWEILPSPGRFLLPVVRREFQYGTIYTQGVVGDLAGNVLSDQALLELIATHGHNAVNYLDGDFVIAVDDSRHGVWCATDPCASLPLYYKLTEDELLITTRAENMTYGSVDDLNIQGIVAVLNSGYPWGDLTLFNDWKVLRPGHVLKIDHSNKDSLVCYFEPETDERVEGYRSAQELINAIDKSLMAIASRHKRILVPLSGGVDSRLIAVRCHALGIPFETITFVANVPEGADFDIAVRLAKVFGVKHHRWQWDASHENCVENFKKLCIATGGTNDAFPSYPDGMGIFGEVAADYDCVLRGDQVFGLGDFADNVPSSAYRLSLYYWDNMDRALKPPYKGVDLKPVFEEQEGIRTDVVGEEANYWRHTSYRRSRNPRFILPVGQLQSQYAKVTYPFLTKEIVARLSRTDHQLRDNKALAVEALSVCSPPKIKEIPFNRMPTWANGDPLFNLPNRVIQEMMEIIRQPNALSEVIDDSAIINEFRTYMESRNGKGRASLMQTLKQMAKKALPKSMVTAYQSATRQKFKAPGHFTFKRYFAMKVFLNSISEN